MLIKVQENMTKEIEPSTLKELILAKQLISNSQRLTLVDSLENNIIAIFNLNSALNIVLKILSTSSKLKLKSIKELRNSPIERQWSKLSEEYKKRYDHELSMKTQIFTINDLIVDFTEHGKYPSNIQLKELGQALSLFIEDTMERVLGIDFTELDIHLLILTPQVQENFKFAKDAFHSKDYSEVLKLSSIAYHLALENQRQKINYLSEQGLLKPESIMLDKAVKIHIEPKDEDFIHLILRTNLKKLETFKQFVPTVVISEDGAGRPELMVSDFVDESKISQENASYCLNFILETILMWESLDLIKK
jgi:hypothetical protein